MTSPVGRTAFRDPKPTAERITQLAQRVLTGDILLPQFQRGFVWERKKVLDLLDSVRRNYPIGSMLLWQTRQELANVRTIADLSVAQAKPDYPVNYLLDGQQRLSTICGALHWEPQAANSIWNIGYDLNTQSFIHLDSVEEPLLHVMPLRHMSNASTYFSRTINLKHEQKEEAGQLFNRFTDYQVAIVTLGDMSIRDVAPVFERINSTGTPLTIVDLMRAATWSPTFDLVEAIDQALEELEPKNFAGVGRKTFLRSVAASAGLGFSSGDIDQLRELTEEILRNAVGGAMEAAKEVADFLSTQIGVPEAKALPYVNQFAVLTELFRLIRHPSHSQYKEIRKWFWKTTLSSYFGGWNTGQMSADLLAITEFAKGGSDSLTNSGVLPQDSIWKNRAFRSNSATSKMFALILAHERPVDLLTGQLIDIGKSLSWGNEKEYHHFFPKAHLARTGISAKNANAVANIVLLTSYSNIKIRDDAPSVYLNRLRDEIGDEELMIRLGKSLISPVAFSAALEDDYSSFLSARAADLHSKAMALIGRGAGRHQTGTRVMSDAIDDSDVDTSD